MQDPLLSVQGSCFHQAIGLLKQMICFPQSWRKGSLQKLVPISLCSWQSTPNYHQEAKTHESAIPFIHTPFSLSFSNPPYPPETPFCLSYSFKPDFTQQLDFPGRMPEPNTGRTELASGSSKLTDPETAG